MEITNWNCLKKYLFLSCSGGARCNKLFGNIKNNLLNGTEFLRN
jgi:hypothetical protein